MIRFAAVGDVSFCGLVESLDLHGLDYSFAGIRSVLEQADLRFGNMESVFIPPEFPTDRLSPRALAAPDHCVPALRDFDVMNMAANHVLDCGTVGMRHTQYCLQQLGIKVFGIGAGQEEARQPLIVDCNGLRLGFLGYQEDCNYTHGHIGDGPAYLAEATILDDMAALRSKVDLIILSLHSDLEFMETPAVWRKQLTHRLAEAGASLILCTHPHVPQGVERIGNALIAHSLGNCLFDIESPYMKSNGPHTSHSFVLTVELSKDGVGAFEQTPFRITDRPELFPKSEVSEAMAYLEHLNRVILDDAIVQANWRATCMKMLELYLRKTDGVSAEDFMDRFAWVLAGIQENRAWTSELVRMAEERFQQQARSAKDFISHNRPSWPNEG